jgi:hypothetical protein
VLAGYRGRERFTILRPAIVESALEYPFPGWNQGFNTTGRSLRARRLVAPLPMPAATPSTSSRSTTYATRSSIAGAAILKGEHAAGLPVRHLGQEPPHHRSRVELTALAHRKHLRRRGDSVVDRVVLSRWDGVPSTLDHTLSVPNLREATKGFAKLMRELPRRWPKALLRRAQRAAKRADELDEKLDTIEHLIELYLPFIHDHFFVFVTDALIDHQVVEPEFRFDPASLDWRRYWIDVHIPGLRKWSYPLIENKTPESYTPRHPFTFTQAPTTGERAGPHGGAQGGVRLTWRSSSPARPATSAPTWPRACSERHPSERLALLVRAKTPAEAEQRLWKSRCSSTSTSIASSSSSAAAATSTSATSPSPISASTPPPAITWSAP